MCCPRCECDSNDEWIVHDETHVEQDWNGKDWMYIVKGCQCAECGHTWYEHYKGIATDFYWTND